MTLGKTIRNLRQAQNLSQEALADKTSGVVSRSYISEIELDKVGDISAAIIGKLADALNTPVEQLLVAAGIMAPKKLSNPRETAKEEKSSFLNFIYNTSYMSTEDKQYFAETVNRAYDMIELRILKEAQKDDQETTNKAKFRDNPGTAPAT